MTVRPLALSIGLIFSAALSGTAWASPNAAVPLTRAAHDAWNRALNDPRIRLITTLDAEQKRNLALEYGLQQLLPGPANPVTTRLVTNCNGSGAGSLRDAVAQAASGDTIDARALTCSGISIGNGAIVIPQNDLTLLGPGRDRFIITTKYTNRILKHTGTGTLTISGLTLRNGSDRPASGPAYGGCLASRGDVALGNPLSTDPSTGVVVTGCHSDGRGGGVFASGTVRMMNSVISGSSAGNGGGLYCRSLAMKYSEVRDNTGVAVGGIAVISTNGGSVLIESSTISGNTSSNAPSNYAKYAGGALLMVNDVRLIQVTISNNSGTSVGGIQLTQATVQHPNDFSVVGSTITGNTSTSASWGAGMQTTDFTNVTLESTIIARNFSPGNSPSDLNSGSAPILGGHNLIGAHNGVFFPVDPLLGPLAYHGGVTRTHLLRAGSPAINAGTNSEQKTWDQRGSGFPRVRGNASDIGATENDPDLIFSNGFE